LYKKKKYIAVILARGGSKRLPNKNLKNLRGKPLIFYTILAALRCRYIDEIIVSSDDVKILEVSKKYRVQTVKRPKYLSGDKSKSSDALKHVISKNFDYDFVILLQPTSPLRSEKHIYGAIRLLEKKNADAVISVCRAEEGLFLTNILPKNLSLQKFFKKNLQNKKNKNINNYYKLNGAIYICKIKKLFEKNTLFLEKNIYAFKMSQKTSIDVDTEFDFKRASNLIK
jgi:CMP-N,N'-diacetyllegionaminic acid synthase